MSESDTKANTDLKSSQNELPIEQPDDELQGYNFIKTLGKGNFGKVKLGIHVLTGQHVAIKILEKDLIFEKADIQRISREIKIMKLIRHPNVIQLYEIIEKPKRLYLIMEYAEGGDLFDLIVKNEKLQERKAARLYAQIVMGLEYLHSKGVTHRDMKPENILISGEDVKIADFGLGNFYKEGELLKTACGSPCYASPQMLLRVPYNPAMVDIWSSGIILYAMACGYLPFEDQSTSRLYEKIKNTNPRYPRSLSECLKTLLKRLLDKNPETRITASQIKNHQWIAEQFKSLNNIQEFQIDHEKIKKIVKLYQISDQKKLINYLTKNKHNNLTTIYYLATKNGKDLSIESELEDEEFQDQIQKENEQILQKEQKSIVIKNQSKTTKAEGGDFIHQNSSEQKQEKNIKPQNVDLETKQKGINLQKQKQQDPQADKQKQQKVQSPKNSQKELNQKEIQKKKSSNQNLSSLKNPSSEKSEHQLLQNSSSNKKQQAAIKKVVSEEKIINQPQEHSSYGKTNSLINQISFSQLQTFSQQKSQIIQPSEEGDHQMKDHEEEEEEEEEVLPSPPEPIKQTKKNSSQIKNSNEFNKPDAKKQDNRKKIEKQQKEKGKISSPTYSGKHQKQHAIGTTNKQSPSSAKIQNSNRENRKNSKIQEKPTNQNHSTKNEKISEGYSLANKKKKQISSPLIRVKTEEDKYPEKIETKQVEQQDPSEKSTNTEKNRNTNRLIKTRKMTIHNPSPKDKNRKAPPLHERSHSRDKQITHKKIIGKAITTQPFLMNPSRIVLSPWPIFSQILTDLGAQGRIQYFKYDKTCIYISKNHLRGIRNLNDIIKQINCGELN